MHGKTILFVIGFALGITIGELSLYGTEAAIASLLLFLFQGAVYFFQKRKRKGMLLPLYSLLVCLGVALGIIRMQTVQEKTNFICTSCTFEAYVITSPEIKNQYQIFSVHPNVEGAVRSIQVRAPLYPRLSIGEKVQLTGKATEPKNITSTSSNQFDYVSYLGTRDIGSEMYFPKVEMIDSEAKSFISQLGKIKENFIFRMEQYVRAPGSSLSSGMLFGNSSMSSELVQTFRTAGLSHIVVLSGFNIAIVISAILLLFSFIPLFIRITLASIAVMLFVMMVGGEASVIRATVMAFIGLLAHLVGRHYVAKQALIISLFLIVLFQPISLLHDASLHLSFLATGGIVYASEHLQKLFSRITNQSLCALFVTTFAAYVGTLPYIMYAFGNVSVYALFSNLAVLPFVPGTMLAAFLVVVSSFVASPLASAFGFVTTMLSNFIIGAARITESFPFSSVPVSINLATMIFLYIILGILLFIMSRKKEDETSATNENGNLTGIISY